MDVFGETETGGGFVPYGVKVQARIFLWATASIIIALIIPVGLGTNSKKNNPKSIDNQVETYFLPEYDIFHHYF